MTYTADANSLAWKFWDHWADGRWEPTTHRTIVEHCHGGTFVDIGAWVGPTSIWAAQAGYSRIVAVEPDVMAFFMLRENVRDLPVEIVDVAVWDHNGTVSIEQRGDSMSQVDLANPDHPTTPARCVTFETLFREHRIENVDLIKIDVEGAEARIIPQAAPFLREVGAPIHLSTHPWNPLDWSVLDGWTVERLGDDEWLVTP